MKKNLRKKEKLVFVGLSGGVDSSVALALLKKEGYKTVGVFIKTWSPDFINCSWSKERREAIRICSFLNVPFIDFDATEEYKREVANYMIEEYRKGRTPNPDVMCNRQIKFGAFWEFAKSKGADYIATGHYAKKEYQENEGHQLLIGPDKNKDQVYFLWTLNQEDLGHSLFPIGNMTKEKVRKLAKRLKLPNADKKDSQGVCFLGKLDMKEFLSHYIKKEAGKVLSEEGEIIGEHTGSMFYTLGERHGFKIEKKHSSGKPFFVIGKDIKNNTITVSNELRPEQNSERKTLRLNNCNWIGRAPLVNGKYQIQIRYHGKLKLAEVENIKKDTLALKLKKNILADSGQSVVIYDGKVLLGGGVIS